MNINIASALSQYSPLSLPSAVGRITEKVSSAVCNVIKKHPYAAAGAVLLGVSMHLYEKYKENADQRNVATRALQPSIESCEESLENKICEATAPLQNIHSIPKRAISCPAANISAFHGEAALAGHLPKPEYNFVKEFLEPNEYCPENIAEHLMDMKPNTWGTSTGTERSLFFLLSAPEHCEGIIVRDINWKVKAYIDCIVLLLRLCNTQAQFKELSAAPPYIEGAEREQYLQEKCRQILQILEKNNSIPSEMKKYYKINLKDLVHVYIGSPRLWQKENNRFFSSVNYLENPDQFAKLQAYARAGRIIATVGPMNDMAPLSKHGIEISVIDTSNIKDYILLDLPEVHAIWTVPHPNDELDIGGACEYFSTHWNPLIPEKRNTVDRLVDLFKRSKSQQLLGFGCERDIDIHRRISARFSGQEMSKDALYPRQGMYRDQIRGAKALGYSKECLEELSRIFNEDMIQVAPNEYIDIGDLMRIKPDQFTYALKWIPLETLIQLNPKFYEKIIPFQNYSVDRLELSLLFAGQESWKTAFEFKFRDNSKELNIFTTKLQEYADSRDQDSGIFEQFKNDFRQERWNALFKS